MITYGSVCSGIEAATVAAALSRQRSRQRNGPLRFAVLVNNAADAWYMIERMQHQLRKAWEVDQ